jgi:hypothetical protein
VTLPRYFVWRGRAFSANDRRCGSPWRSIVRLGFPREVGARFGLWIRLFRICPRFSLLAHIMPPTPDPQSFVEELYARHLTRSMRSTRSTWAELLRRVFALDVLTCPHCGGPQRPREPRMPDSPPDQLSSAGHLTDPTAAAKLFLALADDHQPRKSSAWSSHPLRIRRGPQGHSNWA